MTKDLRQRVDRSARERFASAPARLLCRRRAERELAATLDRLRQHQGRLHRDAQLSRANLRALAHRSHSGVAQVAAGVPLVVLERELGEHALSLGPLSPGATALDVAAFLEGPYAGLRAVPGGRLESTVVSA